MSVISYQAIDPQAIIDIKVSGSFYKQIMNVLLLLGDSKSPEEFKEVLEAIKGDNPPKDCFHLNVKTLVALVFEIETQAKAQDKLKTIEIDPEKG